MLKNLILQLGTDKKVDELVALLNAKTIKQKTLGRCSVAGMGDHSPQLAAKFLMTMRGTIAALAKGNEIQQAQGILFDSFLSRFINNADGLDFENEILRSNLLAITTAAGWTQQEIDALLAIGYVMVNELGYEVTAEAVKAALDAMHLEAKQVAASQAGNEVWNQFMTLVNAWDGSDPAPTLEIK